MNYIKWIIIPFQIYFSLLYADDDWTNVTGLNSPPARYAHSLASLNQDNIILFAGRKDVDILNDTWIYNISTNNWISVSASPSPLHRYWHSMSYIDDGKALMFGGNVKNGSIESNNETWIFDISANTWTQLTPISSPQPRAFSPLAYIMEDKVILFGGENGSLYNDTWMFDLSDNTWTNMQPANSPTARSNYSLVYIGSNRACLFGGIGEDGFTKLNDTWIYDLNDNNWIEDSNSISPNPRQAHQMTETSMSSSTNPILFGGYSVDGINNETWLFGGGDYKLNISTTNSIIPNKFQICSAYPNPFNPSITIRYGLDLDSEVSISIYDITGKEINNLLNTDQLQGWHSIEWNGTDHFNNQVPAGIYIGKIKSNEQSKNVKLMYLK